MAKQLKLRIPKQQNNMEAWPWIQRQRYLQLMGKIPEEFEEGSEGHSQFSYNPRTKKGRDFLAKFAPKLNAAPRRK